MFNIINLNTHENDSQTPQVAAFIISVLLLISLLLVSPLLGLFKDLWRCILQGEAGRPHALLPVLSLLGLYPSEAEIDDFHLCRVRVVGEEEVLGFQVAMDNTLVGGDYIGLCQ